jgi:hypothetical protein
VAGLEDLAGIVKLLVTFLHCLQLQTCFFSLTNATNCSAGNGLLK